MINIMQNTIITVVMEYQITYNMRKNSIYLSFSYINQIYIIVIYIKLYFLFDHSFADSSFLNSFFDQSFDHTPYHHLNCTIWSSSHVYKGFTLHYIILYIPPIFWRLWTKLLLITSVWEDKKDVLKNFY